VACLDGTATDAEVNTEFEAATDACLDCFRLAAGDRAAEACLDWFCSAAAEACLEAICARIFLWKKKLSHSWIFSE
jgi:hypothetical protein